MKNLLIATTALVATAGMASAEITFSGKGEAGMYRDGKTKAVVAVAGTSVEIIADDDDLFLTDFVTQVGTEVDGEDADSGPVAAVTIGYNADGVLTTVANSGELSVNVTAADEDGGAAENTITLLTEAVRQATADVAFFASSLAEDDQATLADRDAAISDLADAQGALALTEAALAAAVGTLPVAGKSAGDMIAYSGYDFDVTVSAETDGGLTFGMAFDMGAGQIADQNDDRAMDTQIATIATSALTIGMNGYTLSIGQDKVDDTYDDTQNGDIGLSGNVGSVAFNLVHDLDEDVAKVAASTVYTAADETAGEAGEVGYVASTFTQNAAVAIVNETTSLSLGGAVGDVAWSLAATTGDDRGDGAAKGSVTYSGVENLSLTLAHDNVGNLEGITKVTAAYTMGSLKATLSMADDKDHAGNTNKNTKASNNLSLAYAANGLAATFATDESSQWWINTQYDLGGGAQAFATIDHTEFAVVGVNFAF